MAHPRTRGSWGSRHTVPQKSASRLRSSSSAQATEGAARRRSPGGSSRRRASPVCSSKVETMAIQDILDRARKLESRVARALTRAAEDVVGSAAREPLEIAHAIVDAVERQVE